MIGHLPPRPQDEGFTSVIGLKSEEKSHDVPGAKVALPLSVIVTWMGKNPAGVCGGILHVMVLSEAVSTGKFRPCTVTTVLFVLVENPLPDMVMADVARFMRDKTFMYIQLFKPLHKVNFHLVTNKRNGFL